MIVTLLVLGLIAVFSVVLGSVLLGGKGVNLINMPAKRKAEWDEGKLCRFVGWFMMFLALCMVWLTLSIYFGWHDLEAIGLIVTPIGICYVIIRLLMPVKKKTNKTNKTK